MGDLPPDRAREARPFLKVGSDFAGPFSIKSSRLRGSRIQKAYLCVFVCFSTKAVHLEVVSDMSTDAFLAAFSRFTARRGLCSGIRWHFNLAAAPHLGGLWEAAVKSA